VGFLTVAPFQSFRQALDRQPTDNFTVRVTAHAIRDCDEPRASVCPRNQNRVFVLGAAHAFISG
jgi:hypothetical protein